MPVLAAASDEQIAVQDKLTSGFFQSRLRYDRFFSTNNMGYVTVLAGLDRPAAKRAFVGGQLGYARQLVKTTMHLLAGEIGYDGVFINYIEPMPLPPAFVDNVFLHSLRLYVGYVLTVREHTTLDVNVEGLINLNSAHIGDQDFGPGEASRVNGKLAFTTKIWRPMSLRAATNLRFNNAPGLNTQIPLLPTYMGSYRYNQKLDTLTELSLIVNFI
jgi:hypothetical protein